MLAAVLLGLTGLYTVFSDTRRDSDDSEGLGSGGMARLLVTGFALSVDNLVVGFALGAYHVAFVVAAALIAAVSVAMSLVGLELGSRLGEQLGRRSEWLGGAILIALAGAIGAGVL